MSRYGLLLLTTMALTLFSACAPPATRFYTLSSVPVVSLSPRTEPHSISIAFDSVTVPELVDRMQIVTKPTANRVFIDDFARWADPMKTQISRVVAADVAHLIPDSKVTTYPQRADGDAYRVSVDVQAFDSSPGDLVTIAILWSVISPAGGKPMSGRTVTREFVGASGYEALVRAHSRALARAANDIATATRSMIQQQSGITMH